MQNMCQWVPKDTAPPTNTDGTTPSGQPLFSTPFCHPVEVSGNTTEAVWETCTRESDPTGCSTVYGCNWSDGKELIPPHDFCAPMDVTNDVTLISECVSAESNATCGAGCAWRHGSNGPSDGSSNVEPLFSEDFCHPVSVSSDT
jgi:hypothetical protein